MYHANKTSIGKGIWRLNDEILEGKTLITRLLRQSFEPSHYKAKNYDIFKSRIRDSQTNLYQKHKKKKVLEKQLMKLKTQRDISKQKSK